MVTTTIRVSLETHRQLAELARELDMPIQELMAQAVEMLRRKHMFEQANAAYAALRNDPIASAAWDAEMAAWDVTLADGLEPY